MSKEKERNFGLDLVRSLAISLVIISHATYILFPVEENPLINVTRVMGAVGVDLFFVLSGFLIGGILLENIESQKTGFFDLLLFLKRRWLRTLPNYFLILMFNIFLILIIEGSFPENVAGYFIFLQNFSSPHPNFFTEAWSLSIEEYAYLLLPFLIYLAMYLIKFRKKKLFLWVTLMVIIGLLFFKIQYFLNVHVVSYSSWSSSFRKIVLYRIDSIYFGFLLVYFFKKYKERCLKNKGLLALVGLLLFISMHGFIFMYNLLPQTHLTFYVFVYLQMLIICLGITFPFFISMVYSGFFVRGILYLSKRSYAIYLINYSLVLLVMDHVIAFEEIPFYLKLFFVLVYLLITISFSEILYRKFEQPILNYRNRKYPS